MNNLLANPKQQFLLGAGLDVLHHESTEWLNTIAFWKEEMDFFYKLLHLQDPIHSDDKKIEKIIENLEKIQSEIFSKLKVDVLEHEKLLVELERNKEGISDWEYREKHRRIKARMEFSMADFKSFKKVVFGFVKTLRA